MSAVMLLQSLACVWIRQMSELIHGKLYRRNRELEAEISSLKLELTGWQAAAVDADAEGVTTTPLSPSKQKATGTRHVLQCSHHTSSLLLWLGRHSEVLVFVVGSCACGCR